MGRRAVGEAGQTRGRGCVVRAEESREVEGEESDEKRDGVETMVSECSRREGNFEGDDERRTEQGLTEI